MAEATGQALAAPLNPIERIQNILLAEKPPEKAPPKEEVKPEVTEEEVPAAPNQQVEGQEPEPEEVADEQTIPLDQVEAIELEVTVKGDGGEDVVQKLPVKELKAGYMRQADYSRKTAELARQREEVDLKTRQGIESERTALNKSLEEANQLLLETAASELKDVNWNHLAANDPAEYVRLDNRRQQFIRAHSEIQSKQAELAKKGHAEQAQAKQKAAEVARTTLERDIPAWSDELYQKLMKTGVEYGFKPEEVGSWVDSRAIKVLHDAYQFRQMKSEKPVKDNKVVNVPKVVVPGAKKPAAPRGQEALKRLQSSGRIEDAAAVIKSRMG